VWETYLSAAFLRVKDPFDNLPFLLCVAQTFGGQVNLQAMQVIDMLVLTFKALAFTALVVKMHLIDPFKRSSKANSGALIEGNDGAA